MSWKDTLLDASFKGVGFDVIDDTLRGTHALAEHEYPFVQGSDIEDTGVSAMDMSLTAVLWGDDYESRLQSLLGVLDCIGQDSENAKPLERISRRSIDGSRRYVWSGKRRIHRLHESS